MSITKIKLKVNHVWNLKKIIFNIEGYGELFSGITPNEIYLDVHIYLEVLIRISTNNNIITKDTDTHTYLNFRSSHPKHIKINIPFNLASRIINDHKHRRVERYTTTRTWIVFEKLTIFEGNSWTWYTESVRKRTDTNLTGTFALVREIKRSYRNR